MRLEQAVFTSIRGPRLSGYQLAARSAGVSEALAQELTAWGPAHDSLWTTRHQPDAPARDRVHQPDAPARDFLPDRSVNFHPLSGGEYCLSVTTLAGAEYSGRGGGRVYTQMLVLPAKALARFANDPFLILRALEASGRLTVYAELRAELPSLPLIGRSDKPSAALQQTVLDEVSPAVIQEIADAIASSSSVAVISNRPLEPIFQVLLHTLPCASRLAVSFTTGLKDSPRRPFKLHRLPDDPSLVRQSQRMPGAKIIDLACDQVAGR